MQEAEALTDESFMLLFKCLKIRKEGVTLVSAADAPKAFDAYLERLKRDGTSLPIAGAEAVKTIPVLKDLARSLGCDVETKDDVKQRKKDFVAMLEPSHEMVTSLSNLVGQIVSRKKAQDRKVESAEAKKRENQEKQRKKVEDDAEKKRKLTQEEAAKGRAAEAKNQGDPEADGLAYPHRHHRRAGTIIYR